MKKKQYFYVISYFHSKGNGCCQLSRNKKIKTIKDFDEVRSFIEKNNGLETVVIINIMLMGKEWR